MHYDDEGYLVKYEDDKLFGKDGESLRQQEYYIFIKDDGGERYEWMIFDDYVERKIKIDKKKMELLVNDDGIHQQQMMNTISKEDDVHVEKKYDIHPVTEDELKDISFEELAAEGGKKKRKTRKNK